MFGIKKEEITSLKKMTIDEMHMRGHQAYELISEGSKTKISMYRFFYRDNKECKELQLSTECGNDEVLKILNDCRLMSWDGFKGKHLKNVHDGTMFDLEAIVNEDKTIRAEGSQNFPKHYSELMGWINEKLRNAQ
ncbi:MAG: hypothetical protein IJJ00_07430 [Erysipelotrichaceae bacterium]|nr:hypothetical protein [Erysipelotrichaceae bacterium]